MGGSMQRSYKLFLGGLVAGCAIAAMVLHAWSMISYPGRTLADWRVENARAEVQRDIAARSLKIYVSGTYASYAPGIDVNDLPLVEHLPRADAGIGCVIDDARFRAAQLEYATEYNRLVVRHLKEKRSSPTTF
jgi:hypothetical protein